MKKLLSSFALLLLSATALAQTPHVVSGLDSAATLSGNELTIVDVPNGSGGYITKRAVVSAFRTPGGTTNQIQYNNAGAFGGFTVSGDGTLNVSTGALAITKTGGVSFGALATLTPGTGVATALTAATNANSGVPIINGSFTVGHCVQWSSGGLQDAGGICAGGSTVPGGSTSQLQYNNASAFAGLAGSSVDGTNRTLSLTSASLTTAVPILALNPTWNNSGVTFTGLLMNLTDTASGSISKLIDLQVASSSKFSVDKAGNSSATSYSASASILAGSVVRARSNSGQLTLGASDDLIISRPAANIMQIGNADASAAIGQTLGVQNVVAGTTNTTGTDFTIRGSASTGSAAGGSILFQVAPAGSAGTAQNAFATALTIASTKVATFAQDAIATNNVTAGNAVGITSKSLITSATDGNFTLSNNAANSFSLLRFGGATSSFPALKRNTTALNVRLADDSADATLTAKTQSPGDNATNVATTAFVTTALSGISSPITPNVQFFTSSGTYTVPAGARALHIRMVGGGGGGSGSTGGGGTGGTSTFGTSFLTANGGVGGATTGQGGLGGTVTGCTLNIPGAPGVWGVDNQAEGGNGGSSYFGGGGQGAHNSSGAGGGAGLGNGAGGGGGAGNNPVGFGGGGAGGLCEHWISSSLSSSYSFSIGAAGSAGTGANAGGAGAGGALMVEAY